VSPRPSLSMSGITPDTVFSVEVDNVAERVADVADADVMVEDSSFGVVTVSAWVGVDKVPTSVEILGVTSLVVV